MVSKRQKPRRSSHQTEVPNSDHSPLRQIFQTLVSAADAPEALKLPLLKKLYSFLIHLCSHQRSGKKEGDDLIEWVFEIYPNGIRVTSEDICRLSDILFKELRKSFQQLLSALHDVSVSGPLYQASSHPDILVVAEELNLRLRCCMVILDWFDFRKELLLKYGQVLLLILRTLKLLDSTRGDEKNAISFDQYFSSESIYGHEGFTVFCTKEFVASWSSFELSDSCIPILSAILEVFVDELFIHVQSRGYFRLIDSYYSTGERLFMRRSGDDDIGIVMEILSIHFSLFFSKEEAFENFVNRLLWLHKKDFVAPELSLTAALSLLHKPVMLSGPKLVQTYMISLVSESIGIGMDIENSKQDLKLMTHYLLTFKSSVVLYTKHISHLQMEGHPTDGRSSFLRANTSRKFSQPFESYVQPDTRKKISCLITKFNDSWNSHLGGKFLKTKSDLATSAIAYMKENKCVLDISCRDGILSIVSCIILRASADINDIAFHANGDTSMQDACFLASLLKLMSISLLQALWCLRHSGKSGCLTTLNDLTSCKAYDSLASIISCFSKHDIQLPIQNSLCSMMEAHPTKHKDSKMMFFHFLRLLSFSFVSGFDFLVKGSVLSIMALMNLFAFEEGNIDAFWPLVDSGSQSFREAVGCQISSFVVASKFQKIQTLYLRPFHAIHYMEMEDGQPGNHSLACVPINTCNAVGTLEGTEATCNGKNFLRSFLQTGEPSSDIDDLADFIECKEGKDYSGWLKDRQKYLKWKYERKAAKIWKKKKKTWKSVKGKKK